MSKYGIIIWPILILLSTFYCVYFWVRFGDPEWVKSGHRAILLQGSAGPRQMVVQVNTLRYVAQRKAGRRVERWFLDRMRKAGVENIGVSVWGWLYGTFGPVLPYWRRLTVLLLAGIVVQGYVDRLFVPLVFGWLSMVVAGNVVPAGSSLLLPEGRRLRYDLTILAAVLTTLLLIVIFTVAVALSWVLASLLPPISWGTHRWLYAGIPGGTLWLVCLPVPWFFLSRPAWLRLPTLRSGITIVVALVSIGEVFAGDGNLYHGPTLLAALLIGGWVLFPLTLWLAYRRGDLVGQRPGRAD